ncbi:voltage-dependent T-type calcium channel subunit alpha-1I isoform X1 [Acinonyx jubatus]|uniref:Voltage-dependent T-type calcium channel subunit alpha n=1 Tax=Acinonyx jubatus TaxID=32536 RepID=A0ABM3QFU3_ACIJB|nr:voltage-dependent T-type calcium channel subunit alpha-1I isoform X1 [Acinonyx jubatus]XP_053082799.1 voltage-dependent T-type calcium channel subunit alpha-1I isoform X1 [Acinonyx jubatus]
MAESSSPPSSSAAAAAPAAELGVTEQPGPQSPPPSPPGLEEPLDGADPEVPHPDLAPVAFFCLRQTTSPRNWCIKMVCNPWFECVSMLVILLNCVTLGMYQPCDDMDCLSDRCKILQVFDDFIFVFFAMEMVLKMVALGIFGKKCYLGDTWNRLDFFIVMAGMVEYSLDLQNINLSAIRTVRVLRPLKAINRVPSMRILVNLLLDTLPMLGNVLLLCFFVFFIFGIIGVQLWAGLLRNRCFLEENFTIQGDVALPPYYQPEEDDEMPFICSLSGDNGIMGCHEIPPLKEQGRECCLSKDDVYDFGAGRQDLNASGLCVNWNRYYNVCRTGSANPHKGAINFDNIGYAWIVIFQVITLEGWVEIMYYVMDAHSFYNFIYFILLIIVGSFFMINLCLVVIATQFSETKQREHRLMLEQRQRYLSSSTVASYAEPGDCYEEIFQYVCHILRKARRRALGLYQALQSRRRAPGPGASPSAKPGPRAKEPRHYKLCPRHSPLDPMPHTPVQPISAMLASDPASCPRCQHEGSRRPSGPGSTDSGQEGSGSGGSGGDSEEVDGDGARSSEDGTSSGLEKEDEEAQADGAARLCGDVWRETRAKLRGIVDSKYFNRGIMMAILVNTVSMGIEHHEQPEELTNILEICNVVFTSMFALEMLLKLAAFGLFDYLRNPYNIFDSIIVIISIWEIVGQADGGLSVLRTFRLLRVLKLVRFMPALRRQLVVLMKTMDNVATFCMLLMLFIFIFSILGMHIFGCKFSLRTDTGDTVPDRKNFDSLLWAIVTVFQILTQEDWNVVLYNGMASTSPWASLYFVALMTFGNYVLFNLLVAILVEGFQAEGDANRSYSDEDQSSSNMEEFDKLQEGLDSGGDPKICPIPMTPNGHLDPSRPLGGHLGPPGAAAPAPRLSLQPDPVLVALGSRKSSVMSLGRMSCDQRSLSSSRSSYYGPWGRSGAWASRRSSWNSLKHKPQSAEHESLLSAERGVGPRACEGPRDEGPPRAAPLHAPHAHHVHHGPHPAHRHRHHRRTLSLDTRDSMDLAELVPAVGTHPRATWRAVGPAPGHEDCNGRMPSIAKDVFTKMDDRRDRGEDEEEMDYTLCFRVRKMIDVYKPDWCEVREDWSVYLFSPENRFRVLCQTIIAHKLFDYVVLAFIFLNCITIALERPQIEAGSTERIFLTVSNYIFTAIFVGEMTLKVVSLGLYFGEQAYLRSSWNVLDGFLVFVSIIDIVVSVASAGGAKILGVLRVLRLLRTLRPLRVISRAPGLKLVVETLISSLKPIGNIVLICCAFFIIFGILGVQLFKGKFYHCLGVDTRNITNRSDCVAANYRWVHHKYNFDNLGQALMSLFVLASKDGWVNIMYNGLDAVAVDQQPVPNHNPWMLLYFISFLLIVSFFVLNMFVGVVVENFHKCRQHQEAEEARRREEKRLRRLEKKRRKAQRLPYYATYCPTRLLIHSMCTSHYLDIFITFIICLNVVTMSLEHYNQPTSLETALKYCNYMFTTVFVLEAVLKLVAFGLRRFFKDRWNQLDLAIVLLSVMGITLEEIEINAALPINPTIIRIMRVLRIARVLKLLKMATGMRALLDTVVQALPQVGNLGLLFMLLFFIYAALGVELFGKLVCNDENPCEGMSRHATFENFGMAFLTLFQVSTGDNWNGIMKDTLRDCTHDERSCLSSLQFVSPLYFVSFVLTAQFVLINVVVAVLMKHLDDSNKEAQEDAEMDAELELEMAHGLGPSPRPPTSSPGAPGRGPGGPGGGGDAEGRLCRRCYSPAQENLWLDSVSLIIKDSLEGELTIIDNLSGSIFHHYSSPAGCEKCHHDKQEVQLAETEAFSLNSDKSSSILLGDDLSLEGPTVCPLGPKDSRGEPDAPEPMHGGEGGECFFPLSNTAVSSDPENFLWERETVPSNPVRSWLKHESGRAAPPTPFSPDASSPLLPMPAEFFHPAVSASQKGQEKVAGAGTLPKIALQGSWASLRSPNVNCTLLRQATGSDTSLEASRSSSAGSLQTTLEDSLTLSDSPRRALGPPAPALGPRAGLSPAARRRLSLRGRGLFTLRGLRAHQRSHSSGGSTSPGCTHHDSMDPSDEEGAGGRGGAGGGGAGSEHSETLSSLSLTSLFGPPPPLPGLTPARRFSSTSSLAAGPGRPRAPSRPRGLARSPSWAADRSKDAPGPAPSRPELPPAPGELQPGEAASKRKR